MVLYDYFIHKNEKKKKKFVDGGIISQKQKNPLLAHVM
jgi:hypothetical protein